MKRNPFLFSMVALGFALSGPSCGQPAPQPRAPEITYHEYTGIVTAIDTAAPTISVAKNKQMETFAVDCNTTIKLKRKYKLAEIPVKSKVFVRYKQSGGNQLAVRIQIIRLSRAVRAAR
jgi:hypothetical protein